MSKSFCCLLFLLFLLFHCFALAQTQEVPYEMSYYTPPIYSTSNTRFEPVFEIIPQRTNCSNDKENNICSHNCCNCEVDWNEMVEAKKYYLEFKYTKANLLKFHEELSSTLYPKNKYREKKDVYFLIGPIEDYDEAVTLKNKYSDQGIKARLKSFSNMELFKKTIE